MCQRYDLDWECIAFYIVFTEEMKLVLKWGDLGSETNDLCIMKHTISVAL